MRTFGNPSYYATLAGQAQTDAVAAARDARDAQESVESLRQDVNRLLLITEALWTLLKKQHDFTDDDLTKVVNEIDLQDGVLDGKPPKAPPRPCPYCGKMVAAHHTLCIYCGRTVPEALFGR